MLALNTLLAQIGSFVPAHRFVFALFSAIFAKLSFSESIELGLGSYLSELRDIATINQNILKRSLVVVDELGSTTSHSSSLPVCSAFSEFFLTAKDCMFFFSTHNSSLAKVISRNYSSARRLFMNASLENTPSSKEIMKFSYQVEEEKCEVKAKKQTNKEMIELYGIRMAEALGLP